ncbi:MAG TPA: fibronectin type III domain-containing protein, partial [Kineosporiaceae bacterium]|nr:fibronectin type III domain-containing protein [Kineosporiaceae bacterium]
VLAGVYAHDNREELVLPAAFNEYMQWFNEVAPGIVSWATRGIHLGYQRNYFNVHVDDVFLADSRWSVAGHCTPGDGCVDPTVTTPDIRMTAADVANLVAWQTAHGFKLDMAFNGGGAELAKTATDGSDPLANAEFLKDQAEFSWINHTYTHPYLGCIQIAPTEIGQTWHCATAAGQTPRQDEEIPDTFDATTSLDWASQAAITQQVGGNITWAQTNGLTNFNATELVTGEHSGLASLPQQPVDNPFLAPALAALHIAFTGSDGSREAEPRLLDGGSTVTVPRHPMNIFYNAGTYQDEVDEYNWIYTAVADGGGGICTANPTTSTCITPLPAGSNATARASFDSYIKPLEIRNALKYVLTNDPRPFYAHQSNLAEDGILYPVVQGVLDSYAAVYDTATTPIKQTGLTGQYDAISKITNWKAVSASVDGYVDGTGVHTPAASVAVPITVPAGSTGAGLESYAGSLSGWVGGAAVVVPPTTAGGYLVAAPTTVPGAPTIGSAAAGTPGSGTATVAWTAPAADGGSPITGYVVRGYVGAATTPSITANVAAGLSSTAITGLTNGTSYTFDVAAVNAVGTGLFSAISNAVVPAAPATVPGAPTIGTAVPGSTTATVAWAAPASDGGSPITGYVVRGYRGAATTPTITANAAAGSTSTVVAGLVNGTSYRFDVAAVNAVGTGPFSAISIAVVPRLALAPVPSNVVATAGNASASVTWSAPATTAGVTGYRVRAYTGTSTQVARTVTVAATQLAASVTGLTNGTSYTFDVASVYGTSIGPVSVRSAAVTPSIAGQGSAAPTITTVVPAGASAVVSWLPPAVVSATPTGYRVRAFVGSGTTAARTVTVAGTATTATVTGLTNGTGYTFDVTVQYSTGNGATSARSAAVVPVATVPGAPVIGVAASGAAGGTVTATARWAAPASNGGSAVLGYVVTATAANGLVTVSTQRAASSRSYSMTLAAGQYSFTVVAVNVAGTGQPSARSNVVTAQ